MAKIKKNNEFLQCGCKDIEQPNLKINKNPNTRGTKCECTIQNKEGFVKDNGIVTLKFKKGIFLGVDSSIE